MMTTAIMMLAAEPDMIAVFKKRTSRSSHPARDNDVYGTGEPFAGPLGTKPGQAG